MIDAPVPAPTPAGLVLDAGEPPHILVVDDDDRIRGLLKRYLSNNGLRATEAREAAHARRLMAMLSFDLVVADVMMPGENGFDLARHLRSAGGPPVLLLTARGEASDRIAGLEAGADDYLAKPFEPRELLLQIEAILRRAAEAPEPPPDPGPLPLSLGKCQFDPARGELRRGTELIRLTAAEADLMRALARTPHEPVARRDLLAQLGDEAAAQERAIDVQITRLRKKIEENPRAPRYLQTVRGSGYMLAPDQG